MAEPKIECILEAACDVGAVGAHYVVLRLPFEVNPLFQERLEAHFREGAARAMSRMREIRDGKDYDSDFSKRKHGEGVWADMIHQRFNKPVEWLGLSKAGVALNNSTRHSSVDRWSCQPRPGDDARK